MFNDLVCDKNFEMFKNYRGPVSAMAVGKKMKHIMPIMKSIEVVASTRRLLEYLCVGYEVAPEFRNGKVSEQATRQFMASFSITHFADEYFLLTERTQPDNVRLTALAKAAQEKFEAVLAGFETRRPTDTSGFLGAAKEYMMFLREWMPRDAVRVSAKAHQLIVLHYAFGHTDEDEQVKILRETLKIVGGQKALEELDRHKARLLERMRAVDLAAPVRPAQVVAIGPHGRLAVVIDAPTTFTEEEGLLEAENGEYVVLKRAI